MRRNRPALLTLAVAALLVLSLAHPALAGTASPHPSTTPQTAGAPVSPDAPTSVGSPAASSFSPDSDSNESDSHSRVPETRTLTTPIRNLTETSNYLTIADSDVERSTYGNSSLDVAGALDSSATELRHEFESISWKQAFDRAETDASRVALIRNETRRIEMEIRSLDRRQTRLIGSYNAGDVSTTAFFRELARIDAAARQLNDRLKRMDSVARKTIGFRLPTDVGTRITNVQAALAPLRGNVRHLIGEAITGQRNVTTIYTVTSGDAVVLAANTDRLYLREAFDDSARRPDLPDQFADGSLPRISAANERAAELYPWVWSIPGPPNIRGFGNTSVYNITDSHPHGDLNSYLDGATRDVFREHQWKSLARVPTQTLTSVNGSLQLTVNRTHSTGPMAVTVTDVSTNETVAATVRVNGQRVGSTGPEGVLWTITPTQRVRVEATTADGRIVDLVFSAAS